MTLVAVDTDVGLWEVDLDGDEVVGYGESEAWDLAQPPREPPPFPRVVAAAAAGSTVVAVVARRPPLMISHDAGLTWHESGGGLPAGRDVAVAESNPDLVVFASANRLYVSRNGGRFWSALTVELPEIRAVGAISD